MEQDIAILMADLSGYTALTETHGAEAAADLIDKYTAIVEKCLVEDCKLHERTGDEMMIVSSSPDFLLATTVLIANYTSDEENFLQVHGGLHYGNALKRGNSYFGSTINLCSRIASTAKAGTFWCSGDFVDALSSKSTVAMHPRGYLPFKNVREETAVFELSIEGKTAFHIDPVCRMLILNPQNALPHPQDDHSYFCSKDCLEIYLARNPTPPIQLA